MIDDDLWEGLAEEIDEAIRREAQAVEQAALYPEQSEPQFWIDWAVADPPPTIPWQQFGF